MDSTPDVTGYLDAWRRGEPGAEAELLRLVHDSLHAIASQRLSRERGDHTLQPTALVNEAYLRLVRTELGFVDRSHFLAFASETMRRVLVDHARARGRAKRDGGVRVELGPGVLVDEEGSRDPSILDVHAALDELAAHDARKARAAVSTYFGGLSADEIAVAESISRATVERDLRFAKAWLASRLGRDTL